MSGPNADVIKGYEFCATLQLRTPLRVLQHHGEVQQWSENGLPKYAHFLWEGIWLPITYSWEELAGAHGNIAAARAADSFDHASAEMASDIGPIQQDGGTYLGFLRAFRGIVEFSVSPDEKREAIEALSRHHPDYAKHISIHRARSINWLDEWLRYEEWLQVPGIGTRIARFLYDAGLGSREMLENASDTQLSAIKGVGSATIAKIRTVMSHPRAGVSCKTSI